VPPGAPALPPLLAPFLEHPELATLIADYDGTLAPLVDDPATAVPLPEAAPLLVELAAAYRTVAVVSGRPIDTLRAFLGDLPGVELVGLYGMETQRDGGIETTPEVAHWRDVVAETTARAHDQAPEADIVEPKGLVVTLHWRRHPDAEGWVRTFVTSAMARTGLVAQEGRRSLELRPPVEVDKGTAVRRLADGSGPIACFGDDLGDIPAFDAARDLAGSRAVIVAVVDAETPDAVRRRADLTVDGPQGAVELLGALRG
jgi:trehalose 6-phosphate phosphatase